MTNISLTISEAIAEIKLCRPHRMNAVTLELLKDLREAIDTVNQNDQINVIILSGEGKAFCAGVDLREIEANSTDVSSGSVGELLDEHANGVIKALERSPKAVISKINGHCFTGGLEIALAADLIYVAKDAKLADTHAVLGFRPSWGLSQRLPRRVSLMRAKELSFTAQIITGEQAKEYGLALECFPKEKLDAEVLSIAKKISGNSPNSIRAYKDLYKAFQNNGLQPGLEYEANTHYDIPEVKQRVMEFLKRLR